MKWNVDLQNEEINEVGNSCSITGTVNGVQCATVIRCTSTESMNSKEAKEYKQRCLINAFILRQAKPVKTGGDEVEYDPTK